MFTEFLNALLHFFLEIIPSFLIVVLISTVIFEYLPEKIYEKILKKNSLAYVLLASLLGALVPICTCGMIPLANKLQKKGTHWLIVISFLTAGNSCSITALLLTLKLGLGITLLRLMGSFLLGVMVSYIFVYFFKPLNLLEEAKEKHLECHSDSKFKNICNEFIDSIKGFGPWVLTSVFIAAFVSIFLNSEQVIFFSGVRNIFSPLLMSLLGFPFYFCAGTDIPISTAFLEKGAGLGSILSFMIAAPCINLTSLLIYQSWLGKKYSILYFVIIAIIASLFGGIINFAMLPIS